MSVFTNIATGGSIGGGRHPLGHTDPFPLHTRRGFDFAQSGTKSMKLKKGTIVILSEILPDWNTPATAGTVAISVNGGLSSSTVTITNASPGVVTWTAHGLVAGMPVVFTTTGALPTGLTAATAYYVISAGLTANAFQVSATVGGSAINTSSAGSGVHTATAGAQILPATSITAYASTALTSGSIRLAADTQIDFVVASLAPVVTGSKTGAVVRVALDVIEPPGSLQKPYR